MSTGLPGALPPDARQQSRPSLRGPGRQSGPGILALALAALMLLEGCATGHPRGSLTRGVGPPRLTPSLFSASPRHSTASSRGPAGSAGGFPEQRTDGAPAAPLTCGGVAVPPGWPDLSANDAEALLAPFLACASPAEFVALQDRVDMPRLVEKLEDSRAVRLSALGPVREDAAGALNRKRTSFLLHATERYGVANVEVLALFILHSAHDDEVEEVLRLLARDKRLREQARHEAIHGGGNWRMGREWPGEWNQMIMDALRKAETRAGRMLTPSEILKLVAKRMKDYNLPMNFSPWRGR